MKTESTRDLRRNQYMHVYEVQIRETGDRQPLTTYNVLAGDLEDAQEIAKKAAGQQYSTISIEICASREIARDVIFNAQRMRPAAIRGSKE